MIHRDVKPQNVIMTREGRAVLIDFGIARTYKQDAKRDTVFSGTSDFAPPEQYGFAQTDARADIYSLGMLLKFLLTRGDMDSEIADRRLRRIVGRCTAFSPDRRYRSAARLKAALLDSGSKTRRRVFAGLAAAAFAAGLALGLAIPQGGGEAGGTGTAQLKFIPAGLEHADPDEHVVTWAEYCGMLGAMLAEYDGELAQGWREQTSAAPDTEMRRDGGMLALLFAGEAMGADSFNAPPPDGFESYAPTVWRATSMD